MSTAPHPDRVAAGRARLEARARRLAMIRRRIAATAMVAFALAWGVIAWDGSMGVTTTASTTLTASTTAAETDSTTADSTATTDESTDDSTATTSGEAAAVTTAQS